jgi:uncharacterized protein (UPF0335 family)
MNTEVPYVLNAETKRLLKEHANRIIALENERAAIGDDMKDEYAMAKANGFDVKKLKQAIKLYKKPPHERDEESTLVELYVDILDETNVVG